MRGKLLRWVLIALLAAGLTTCLAGDTAARTTIQIALLGDIMLGRGIALAHEQNGWSEAFSILAPSIQAADLAVANLESPLTGSTEGIRYDPMEKSYNLCAPAGGIEALTAAGLDVLTLANNHTGDCGENGLEETELILQQSGLQAVDVAESPLRVRVDDLTLALFAFDDVSVPLDVEQAVEAVSQARGQGDIVLVSIHWGLEYHPGTETRQQEIAQKLAEAGAAVIFGHHPHVLQQVAWLSGGEGGRTLVAYSLGNALFDQTMPDARRSVILFASLNAYGAVTWWAIPFEIDYRSGSVQPVDEATAQTICTRLFGKPGCRANHLHPLNQ